MLPLPRCELFWANLGEGGVLGLGVPGLPFQAPSPPRAQGQDLSQIRKLEGPAGSGCGQSPGAELRRAGGPSVPVCQGGSGLRQRHRASGRSRGRGTPVLMDSRRDSVTSL